MKIYCPYCQKEVEDKIQNIYKYIKSNDWANDYEHSSCRMRIKELLESEDKE